MSFGGSVAAMITSLKNNSRPKRDLYKGFAKSNSFTKKRMRYVKASESELNDIREALRRENRISRIKQIIVISIVVALFVLGGFYLQSVYHIF